jgi:hypothetical protein
MIKIIALLFALAPMTSFADHDPCEHHVRGDDISVHCNHR